MPPRIQCLLFIRPKAELEATNHSKSAKAKTLKGYAFLPLEFISHPACFLLLQNDIQVVTRKQNIPASISSFDVIETLLEPVKVGTTPNSVRFLVDLPNLESVEKLITVRRDKFDFGTKFRRTENIRSAVDEKNLKTMENFLSADLRYCDPQGDGGTLLYFAVQRRYVSFFKLLLKHRADVNFAGPTGFTPLHIAVHSYPYHFNVEIVKLLIKAGANLESKLMTNGFTPIHRAVYFESLESVQLLIENGADLKARTSDGFTCLHLAAEAGSDEGIDFLAQRGAIMDPIVESGNPMEGATPLIVAVKKKWCSTVKRLLENGANVNATCSKGHSVLYYAVNTATLEIVECVLRYRPDVKDAANKRAFELAFRHYAKSSRVIAEKLVEYGFQVGPEDVDSTDFLFSAIRKDIFPVVQKLVTLGAKINKPRPIHLAVQFASEEIVELLLDHGADIETKFEYSDRTPLFEAVAHSNLNVAKLLLARNAKVAGGMLLTAVRRKSQPMVELLLESGIDVNATTLDVPCPLISVALHESSTSVINELMKFGARFDFNFVSAVDNPRNLETYLDYGFGPLNSAAKTCINNLLNAQSNLMNFTNNSHETLKILALHVVKVEVAYGTMNDKEIIPENVYTLFELDAFRRLCQEEMSLMKAELLGWTTVTFFDVLMNGEKGVVRYLRRNKSIERSLKSYEKYAEERYPIYASIIKCHFRQGVFRKKLVVTDDKKFNTFFRHFSALPHDLKEIIVNYLSNQDLSGLRRV